MALQSVWSNPSIGSPILKFGNGGSANNAPTIGFTYPLAGYVASEQWALLQWVQTSYLTAASAVAPLSDPLFGTALYTLQAANGNATFSTFRDPATGNFIYQMSEAGGIYTGAGESDLILQAMTLPATPVTMNHPVMFSLDAKVTQAQQGSWENMAAGPLLAFNYPGMPGYDPASPTITLFVEIPIVGSSTAQSGLWDGFLGGNSYYVSGYLLGDPRESAPLPFQASSGGLVHMSFDIAPYLQYFISDLDRPVIPGLFGLGPAIDDLSRWAMTGFNIGLEEVGPSVLGFAVANVNVVTDPAVTYQAPLQPPTPVITGLTPATDTGASAADGITANTRPTITGTAQPGDTIKVAISKYGNNISEGSTTAGASGAWSYTPAASLPDGAWQVAATAVGGPRYAWTSTSSTFALTINAAPSDFTGDGASDILFRDPASGALSDFVMNSGRPIWSSIGWADPRLQIVGTGDLSGDGTSDILFRDPGGGLSEFAMLNNRPTWTALGWADPRLQVVGIGDFDGDGVADPLFRDPTSGALGEFLMTAGQPRWVGIGWADPALKVVGVGDFNGDGTPDILFRDSSGGLGEFVMHDNQPTWVAIGWADPALQVAGVGDFNGDGTSDILFRDPASGHFSLFIMQNGQPSWTDLAASDPALQVVGVGNYNGGGVASVLLRDPAGGGLSQLGLHGSQPVLAAIGWAAPDLLAAG